MKVLLNLITREQAIDKFLALKVQGSLNHYYDKIITLFLPETVRNQHENDPFYLELLNRFSDKLIIVGNNEVVTKLYTKTKKMKLDSVCCVGKMECLLLAIDDTINELADEIEYKNLHINAMMVWNEASPAKNIVKKFVKRYKGQVLYYFKSIHDKGIGISSQPNKPIGITNRLKRFLKKMRYLFSSKISETKSIYLCYDESNKDGLLFRGIIEEDIKMIRYPLVDSRWIEFVKSEAARDRIQGDDLSDKVIVALFVRGPIIGRPDTPEKQVMPSSLLRDLISDIKVVLDNRLGNYIVYVKPHPNQSLAGLKEILRELSFECSKIVNCSPAFLCAQSDLVITTYSSTCLDALAFGKPVLDYYRETPGFYSIHPLGNKFDKLGVRIARSKDGLDEFIINTFTEIKKKTSCSERS